MPVELRWCWSAVGTGAILMAGQGGCAHHPPTQPASIWTIGAAGELTLPRRVEAIDATCPVPMGWTLSPPEVGLFYVQYVWVSPSGRAAYGVTHISLPLAMSPEFVLDRFLDTMRLREGEARLVASQPDATLPGLKAIAEGGRYRIRMNLVVEGPRVWAIYAGTLRREPLMAEELQLAEKARDATRPSR